MAVTDPMEPTAARRDGGDSSPSLVLARISSSGFLNNSDDDPIAPAIPHVASAVSLPLLFSSSFSGGGVCVISPYVSFGGKGGGGWVKRVGMRKVAGCRG
ncbi:uncharacterized protein DS421_14g467660 [Arachis hypogaea]|nr:uncharacterized protein DS421_14g467660 [Arachis hypogaea]